VQKIALASKFDQIRMLIQACDIDAALLNNAPLTIEYFEDYNNQRIVNSFLFNYMKIQDKVGSKLFKSVLVELREIDDDSMTMIDVLNRLEKLNFLESTQIWDELREIRNAIAHEYPTDPQYRIDIIKLALSGYISLKSVVDKLELACKAKSII